MTTLKKVSVFLVVLLIAFAVWFFNSSQDNKVVERNPEDDALKAAVNDCDSVTERAASHLVAVVEFQKLEIAGRKARVFKLCMQDHGYIENAEWLKFSMPEAEKVAKETNISIDEAIENLRRANMMRSSGENDRSPYWTLRHQATP